MTQQLDRPMLCPILVGRDEYLDALEQALQRARNRRGETVVLGGEAGIGKTRLTRELEARASSLGLQVIRGMCFEPDRHLPYAPLIEPVRAMLARRVDGDVESGNATLGLPGLS